MSSQTDEVSETSSRGGGKRPAATDAAVVPGLAELVAQARAEGVALTGSGGLLSGLTDQAVSETAL
jgi:hypothetical protein